MPPQIPPGGSADVIGDLVNGNIKWQDLSYAQRLYSMNHWEELQALIAETTGDPNAPTDQHDTMDWVYKHDAVTEERRVYTAEDLTARRDTGDTTTAGDGKAGGHDPTRDDKSTPDGQNPNGPGRAPNGPSGQGLPGLEGKDYHFVKAPNGKTYVVYSVKTSKGQTLMLSWSLDADQIKQLGVNPSKVQSIASKQFQNLQFFGSVDEIANKTGDHPLQQFFSSLREQFGHISWMEDPQALGVMLDGWMEGKDQTTIANMLTQTDWYKNTTEAQRLWETKSKADRKASLELTRAQITDAMNTLYGEVTDWQKSFTPEQIDKWSKQIASGKFGSADAGFQSWLSERKKEAEKVEGSQAWIDKETETEAQRAFMNRPADMFEKLRTDSIDWLGVAGPNNPMLSRQTLKSWADDLVTGKKSESDWNQFIRAQARAMYPYLGTNQSWTQFADPYKSKVEQLWGKEIDWSDPILSDLMGRDSTGKTSGQAMSFSDFETLIRGKPQFWQGDTARNEGWDLITRLDSMFNGVNY